MRQTTEQKLKEMETRYPEYYNDFLIDDHDNLIFCLSGQEENAYIKWLKKDQWMITLNGVPQDDQPEAFDPINSFGKALHTYMDFIYEDDDE